MTKKLFLSAVASAVIAMAASVPSAHEVAAGAAKPGQTVVIESGTDPSTVQMQFTGARLVSFHDAGTLRVVNADGTSWKYSPTVYQMVNGKKKYLVPGFRILGQDRVGLTVSGADPSAQIVVESVRKSS